MNLSKSLLGVASLLVVAAPLTAQTTFLTGYALSGPPLRNDYAGFVGMNFTVGSSALAVTSIGRVCVAGNSQTHTVKFVLASTGIDVAGGSASISMAGCTPGQFVYAPPAGSVSLSASTAYYLVSQEFTSGDQWYDFGAVATTADASVTSSVYSSGGGYLPNAGPNTSYVPPNFQYTPPVANPNPPFLTGYNLSNASIRNDYTGFVGMKLTLGATPQPVFSIGRICVAGNSQTHTVKFVLASTGVDVPGASASVPMAGCAAGQFVYASPAGSVTLAANTAYYFVSQETAGGDTWYDLGTVSSTSIATVNSAIYTNGSNYLPNGSTNTSYVPPNFQTGSSCPATMISVSVGTNPPGLSFTVDATAYSSNQTFMWTACSSHSISTTTPQNVTAGSQQSFASWSDAGSISHTVAPSTPMSYTANFNTQYLLTTGVNPGGSGTVGLNPPSVSGYYNSGTVVTLTANANAGYAFSSWTGDLSGSTNPQMLTMSTPHSATANFTISNTPTTFVTSYTPSNSRSDYSGFVGMKLTVGNTAVPVSALGRVCLAGNSQSHVVKFVLASNGTDVPGATATVNMTGCTPGHFVYLPPSGSTTLSANTAYYLMSLEVAGGDTWYDQGSIATTSVATVNNSVYTFNGSYIQINSANTSYVPPNFQYQTVAPTPISVTVYTNPGSLSFSVDAVTYTSTQSFNWIAGQSHTVATTSPQSTGVGVQQAFTNWSDAGAISHTVTPTFTTSYFANFTTQYQLTTAVTPPGAGTVTPAAGFYNSGSILSVGATANPGYAFTGFSGDLSGNTNPQSLSMSMARSVVANFMPIPTTNFITGFALNNPPLRNNFDGFAGMSLTVGNAPLSIISVGRICVSGNTMTHTVKFVNATTGQDVTGGTASVNLSSCSPGFVYAPVATVLQANTKYYLVSGETSGGDSWYDQGTVTSTNVATVNSSIYSNGSSYSAIGAANTAYVPVDFSYSVLPLNSAPAFITAYALSNPPLRNDFTGYVGMKFTVNGTAIGIGSMGRVCVAGNQLTHSVELVNASTNAVLGSVSVNMTGCAPGQFVYSNPSTLIQLQAGSSYYLASQETAGGDQWYDQGTISTTNAGTVNSSEYFYSGSWIGIGSPNMSYVPANFTYAPVGTPIIQVISSQAPNVFGSPSWNAYATNALNGLLNGVYSIGTPAADPTAYFQVFTENNEQNIVSGFNSWLGSATPTAPFASELGNRVHFGLHILGNGKRFSLGGLQFDMESTDPSNTFVFTRQLHGPQRSHQYLQADHRRDQLCRRN